MPALRAAAARHRSAGLTSITGADHAGGHWRRDVRTTYLSTGQRPCSLALICAGRRRVCLALGRLFLSPIFRHFSNLGDRGLGSARLLSRGRARLAAAVRAGPAVEPLLLRGHRSRWRTRQSRALSPTFPIVLLLGAVHGLKIEVLLFACVGMLGFYALGRYLGLDPLVRLDRADRVLP